MCNPPITMQTIQQVGTHHLKKQIKGNQNKHSDLVTILILHSRNLDKIEEESRRKHR